MGKYEGLIKLAKKSNKKNNAGLASMIGGGVLAGGATGGGVFANKKLTKIVEEANKKDSEVYSKWLRNGKKDEALAKEHEKLLKAWNKLKKNKKVALGSIAALGLLGTGLLGKGIYDRNKNKK